MKIVRTVVMVTALAFPSVLLGQQQSESPDQALKAAMHRELVGGDLRAAIKEYEAIVSRYRDNRAVAARALFQIGQCYDKLGQAEARKVYEQVIRDYADQAEPVAQARTRLAALTTPRPTAQPAAAAGAVRPMRVGTLNAVQSISPDGTKAAVIEFEGGQNLAVYDFVSGQSKRLTDYNWANSWAFYGVWSPDSRRIAYMQAGFGGDAVAEVRVTSLTGEARTIFRNETHPGRVVLPVDWLPDGRTLLALLERADGTSAIGFIPAEGGPFTPLRSLQWTGGYPDRPRVSPDGRFVAFVEGGAGTHDIHVLSLDGRTATRLTEHPSDDRVPVWSPDGRHIAFTSTRLGGAALWVVPISDGKLSGDPIKIKEGMQGVSLIEWNPSGLVYIQQTRTDDVYTVAVDQTTHQPVGKPRLLPYSRTGRNAGPVWSPDGRYLAVTSGAPAEPDRRYVVVLPEKGGEPREFLIPTTQYSAGAEPYDLRWFGDGSGLGFSGTDAQGQRTVFQLSLTSGQWKTSPSPVNTWTRIEWDQTGNRYFYARQAFGGGTAGILERDLTTNQDRVVMEATPGTGGFRGLRLSPDRRSLAFTATSLEGQQARLQLMVVDTLSGRARTLLEDTSGLTPGTAVTIGVPAWSPDGRALLVPRTAGQNSWPELKVVPLDGSPVRSFVLDKSFAGASTSGSADLAPAIRDVVWSPDGVQMAFVLSANRLETWIMASVLPSGGSAGTPKR